MRFECVLHVDGMCVLVCVCIGVELLVKEKKNEIDDIIRVQNFFLLEKAGWNKSVRRNRIQKKKWMILHVMKKSEKYCRRFFFSLNLFLCQFQNSELNLIYFSSLINLLFYLSFVHYTLFHCFRRMIKPLNLALLFCNRKKNSVVDVDASLFTFVTILRSTKWKITNKLDSGVYVCVYNSLTKEFVDFF